MISLGTSFLATRRRLSRKEKRNKLKSSTPLTAPMRLLSPSVRPREAITVLGLALLLPWRWSALRPWVALRRKSSDANGRAALKTY